MKTAIKTIKGGRNVFRDIGFDEDEAQNLMLRADLMMKIEAFVAKAGLTQKQAAELLGLTQPRLNLLIKGRLQHFSLDALVNIAARAGMRIRLSVSKAPPRKAA
jgi:predicted XRE-type DNA-binding protein